MFVYFLQQVNATLHHSCFLSFLIQQALSQAVVVYDTDVAMKTVADMYHV